MDRLPGAEGPQYCQCRRFRELALYQDYTGRDSCEDKYRIYGLLDAIFPRCTIHAMCPPNHSHTFDVRTTPPQKNWHAHDTQASDVVCDEVVEYCVPWDILYGLAIYQIGYSELQGKCLVVGEYSRTYQRARDSLVNILSNIQRPGPTDRTITFHDMPELFEIYCSGCLLFREPDENRTNEHFIRVNAYNGVHVQGWFGSYDCKFCPARYAAPEVLVTHQQRCHRDAIRQHPILNKFQCPNCGTSHASGNKLERHWRREHYARLVRDGNMSLCGTCGTEHGDAHGLSTHCSSPAHKTRYGAYVAIQQQRV